MGRRKKNEHMSEDMFCDEFHLVDLRVMDNCLKVTHGADHVFNLAADMGGMGFIQSNHSMIMYNNTMISFNMLEAARINGVKRFFYASSACIYPEFKQLETNVSLKESDAWPAEPQDAYGLEKLATEELCKHYTKDFGIECRVGRFHNIYGPFGTWERGREKAPAAFHRKPITSTDKFEMWDDGELVDDKEDSVMIHRHLLTMLEVLFSQNTWKSFYTDFDAAQPSKQSLFFYFSSIRRRFYAHLKAAEEICIDLRARDLYRF